MSRSVVVELPGDLSRFSMPPALHARLQHLLDLQDSSGKLTAQERREARALTEMTDLMALMKLRARRAAGVRRG